MSQRRFLSVLAAFAFAMAAIFAAMQPSLAEDDENEPTFMQKLFGSVGLLALPGPVIDYKERPPLVVPPVTTYVQPQVPQNSPAASDNPWDFNNPRQAHLPAPDSAPPAPQSLTLPQPVDPYTARMRNPDFPIDPEVKAEQKRRKNTKKVFSIPLDDPAFSERRLTPDEINGTAPPLARNTKDNSPARTKDNSPTRPEGQSTVQELGVPALTKMLPMIGREQEKPIQFTGEPERQTLTQPPSGYLTPSRNAPYGVVTKDRQQASPLLTHPNMPDSPNTDVGR
jgi:hypothetical protein